MPIILKKESYIGTGAIILGGVTIGENSIVGAGAVVTKDVLENSTVAGVPARIISH
jgi:acetyltransferase-like isoleucine patch superfamily enzyme